MQATTKKTILIVIASIAGLFLLAALGCYLYFIFQFTVYKDDLYKFSIKYPKSWKIIVHPHPNVAVIFLRPKDTALDTIQDNFNVTVQAQPPDIENLQQFSARIKTQVLAVFGKNINLVEDKSLHWGWREGHQIAFEEPKPDHSRMVNAWVLRSGQAYILTYFGDMNKYGQVSLYLEEMIRSLELQ